MQEYPCWPYEPMDVLRELASRHGVQVRMMPPDRNPEVAGLWLRGERVIELRLPPVGSYMAVAILGHEVCHCLRSDAQLRGFIPLTMVKEHAAQMPPPEAGILVTIDDAQEEGATNDTALRLIRRILKGLI